MSAESIVYISGSRGETQSGAPHTADLRITGLCQLRCDWCWGPEHFRKGDVAPEEWSETIGRLAMGGTQQLVFSGGEPLLSKALRPGIQAAKDHDLRVTLSTNGILLGKNSDILRSVDDLGIPIDGSTPDVNDAMRTWSVRHDAWKRGVEAIRLAQSMKQEGETAVTITSRTVIAKPNLQDVLPRLKRLTHEVLSGRTIRSACGTY